MSIFRKSEDQHAGSGIDKADPKTLKEKISDTVKAVLPSEKTGKTVPLDPSATVISAPD